MKEAVQIVLLNGGGEVLAVSRKDNHEDFGLIGGKVDPEDNTPEDAAIRETKEETGLDITNLRLIYAMHRNGRMGYTYLADYTGEIHTDEPHVVKWTPFETIMKGSFGYWNQKVVESLSDMGVEMKIYADPENEYFYSVEADEQGDEGDQCFYITPKVEEGEEPKWYISKWSDEESAEIQKMFISQKLNVDYYDEASMGLMGYLKDTEPALIAAGFKKYEE